ncbi:hypothetical protein OG241_27070 [Streptomyces sp. NBC_01390]|uniref:hypothetical protein n=1 Tax=Streptomyces sp. NBC_01390 TaxID=2903850 RepID=UPI00324E2FDF
MADELPRPGSERWAEAGVAEALKDVGRPAVVDTLFVRPSAALRRMKTASVREPVRVFIVGMQP